MNKPLVLLLLLLDIVVGFFMCIVLNYAIGGGFVIGIALGVLVGLVIVSIKKEGNL